LTRLELAGLDLSGAALPSLPGDLPLERLNLKGARVENKSFRGFSRFKHLVNLDLSNCKDIGDDAVSSLVGLPLEVLSLKGTNLSHRSFNLLSTITSLRKLDLRNTP